MATKSSIQENVKAWCIRNGRACLPRWIIIFAGKYLGFSTIDLTKKKLYATTAVELCLWCIATQLTCSATRKHNTHCDIINA